MQNFAFGPAFSTRLMHLTVLGINHRTAPVEVRSQVAFPPDRLGQALTELRGLDAVDEAAILSTCNRTELYWAGPESPDEQVVDWLTGYHGLAPNQLSRHVYRYTDDIAVQHVLRVAAGLDSMVLGEPQILGQMKDCYQHALGAGSIDTLISRLFQHTFSVAKQVRTDTAIGASPVSVAFAAVSLARQIFGDLDGQTALLIGAGETVELAARHLHERNLGKMIVANRTASRAHSLAARFGGYGIGLDEIGSHLGEADIVIASTGASETLLAQDTVAAAMKSRRHRPVLMIDIAVPPDIDHTVADLDDVYLYTVDDLKQVIEDNMNTRKAAAEEAEEIILEQTDRFMAWTRSLDAVPTLRAYREHAETLGQEELERARRALANDTPPDEVIEQLARSLVRKLTHDPSVNLRSAVADGETGLLDAIRLLFRLDNER